MTNFINNVASKFASLSSTERAFAGRCFGRCFTVAQTVSLIREQRS